MGHLEKDERLKEKEKGRWNKKEIERDAHNRTEINKKSPAWAI